MGRVLGLVLMIAGVFFLVAYAVGGPAWAVHALDTATWRLSNPQGVCILLLFLLIALVGWRLARDRNAPGPRAKTPALFGAVGLILAGLVGLIWISMFAALVLGKAHGPEVVASVAEAFPVNGSDLFHGQTVSAEGMTSAGIVKSLGLLVAFIAAVSVIVILVAAAAIVLRLLLRGGGAAGRGAEEDEARILQEVHRGLEGLERRVEALETLMLSPSRASGRGDKEST